MMYWYLIEGPDIDFYLQAEDEDSAVFFLFEVFPTLSIDLLFISKID